MTAPAKQGASRLGTVVGGKYKIVRLMGEGGMGAVYEVQNLALRRSFALKILTAGNDAEALARFRQEAGVIASLRHPNIVEIIDWLALDDGTPAMLMEFLQGQSLYGKLKEGALPWQKVARFADELLAALAVAHRAGIIHRDLKPGNIYVVRNEGADERIKLLDFGISKISGSRDRLTQVGFVLGSPPYMSPEQITGEPDQLGPATDVWAAGAVIYEMATSRRAFDARDLAAVAEQIRSQRPRPIAELRADAPIELQQVIDRALTIELGQRFANVDEMRSALAAAFKPLLRRLPSVVLTGPVSIPAPEADEPATQLAKRTPERAAERVAQPPGGAVEMTASWSGSIKPAGTASTAAGPVTTQPGRTRRVGVALGGGALVGFVVAGFFLFSHPKDPPRTVVEQRTPPVAAKPEPPTPEPAPVPPAPSSVMLTLEGLPPGARVTFDERSVRGNQVALSDHDPHILKVSARGYAPARYDVDTTTHSPLVIRMERKRATAAEPRPVPVSKGEPPMLNP